MYCTDSWLIHSIYSTEISNLQSFLSSFHSFLHSSLFFSYGHSVFSSSLNRTDKNWYCLITNPNFFFELLSFFVFSHFLVDFHRISLIFLSYISQKTQRSKVSSHLDSNTADSTSLITGSTLSYEMFIIDCWFWNWKILRTYWLLICMVEFVLYFEVII